MKKNIQDYIKEFNTILNFSNMCWWIIDYKNDPDYFYCNKLMIENFNLDEKSEKHSVSNTCPISGDYIKNVKFTSTEQASLILKEYFELLNGEREEFNNTFPYIDKKTNSTKYFSSRSKILEFDEKGEVSIIYGIIENITDRILQEEEKNEYNEIIDKYVITSTTSMKGIISNISTAYCEITGYTKKELIGQKHSVLKHPTTPRDLYRDMWRTVTSGKEWEGEIKNQRKDGSVFWIKVIVSPSFDISGNIKYYTTINQDITDKKTIEELSNRDKLTNVYNRGKLDNLLEKEIRYSRRYNIQFALIMIDVDYFKDINDKYGHLEGDKVLIQISQILEKLTRDTDFIGRWGGEEFLIICPNSDIEQGKRVAVKLKEYIENHDFEINKKITASFGITNYMKEDDANDILERADKALYEAKNKGRNRIEYNHI